MGVGKFVGERIGKGFNELSKEANSKSNKVKRRQRKSPNKSSPSSATVQKLFETCKAVFASSVTGFVPPADDVERLQSVLDSMKTEDVGLSPEMPYFKMVKKGEKQPKITYLHLHECDKFSIGIFCLPPSAVIPLHNHPGMTVFSKLLFGTMHIKSYDWVDDVHVSKVSDVSPSKVDAVHCSEGSDDSPLKVDDGHISKVSVGSASKVDDCLCNEVLDGNLLKADNVHCTKISEGSPSKGQPTEVRLAKIKSDADFTTPCNTSILYPSDGGNLHCFTAKTACAVLDVLGPPYSDPDGRHCTYYREHPFPDFSAEGVFVPDEERDSHAWLEDRGEPEELTVVGAMYRGPKIRLQQ